VSRKRIRAEGVAAGMARSALKRGFVLDLVAHSLAEITAEVEGDKRFVSAV
jgi:hypothetical protein